MQTITDFADQMRLLPAALLVAVAFALAGWRRGALAWLCGVGITYAVMAALKMTFLTCGHYWTGGAVQTPSGHAAASALIFGSFVTLLARSRTEHWRLALLAPVAIAILFGLTRLALHVHTPAEVIIGGVVGTLGAYALVAAAGPPPRRLALRLTVPALLIPVLLLPGHMQFETHLGLLARLLGARTFCPADAASLPRAHPLT